jgi:hypothetical protein
MLEDTVETLPGWIKFIIAVGAGTIMGLATAQFLMMMGMGHG